MKKVIYILSGVMSLVMFKSAMAQLPANPWNVQNGSSESESSAQSTTSSEAVSVGADVGHVTAGSENRTYIPSIKYNPVNADATDPVYTPAMSKGDVSMDSSSGKYALPHSTNSYAIPRSAPTTSNSANNWRGSGQFSKLGYKGEVTTYDKAYGQEMLAPEVNNQNMNIMVQHLRSLGYNIPASYDNKFSNFLQDYSADLRTAYSGLGQQNNPVDSMFNGIIDAFEHFTGLDTGNLLFNSISLIQRD